MENRSLHQGIKCLPYEAISGMSAKIGLTSTLLPDNIICNLNIKEDFETAPNSFATILKSSDHYSDNDIQNEKGKIQH